MRTHLNFLFVVAKRLFQLVLSQTNGLKRCSSKRSNHKSIEIIATVALKRPKVIGGASVVNTVAIKQTEQYDDAVIGIYCLCNRY